MTHPLVTVITPTTYDRSEFNDRIASMIQNQDYAGEIEHIFDYGNGTIGAKRNAMVKQASGEIIIHADSDDIYLPTYFTNAVATLQQSKCRLIGLHKFPMHNVRTNDVHIFDNPGYIAEATFCYYKEGFPGFHDISINEGLPVMKQLKYASYSSTDFMATVHGGNTCGHKTLPLIKKLPPDEAGAVLNHFYTTLPQ